VPTSQFDILTQIAPTRNSLSEVGRKNPIVIGVVCTILFHILLVLLAPLLPVDRLSGTHSNLEAIAARKNKTFDFELEQLPPPETPPPPMKFVETNPDAPANEPDKTANFSNRNQQSAQEVAAKEKDPENRPSVKGREDIDPNSAIVSGDHSTPQEGAAVTPSTSQTQAEAQPAQQARAEQIPLSGNEKNEGKSEDGIASNNSQNPAQSNNAAELLEGAKNGKDATGGLVSTLPTSRPQPKPRPRLTHARQTILNNQVMGTTNVGVLGQDARWSEYGDYMNELIEIIDAEWHGMVDDYQGHIPAGTHVIVTFRLSSEGIPSIQRVEETAGKVAVGQCETAITSRQPYRKWTPQMVSVLGTEQTITFGFYYY
jgi:hypothetical protein